MFPQLQEIGISKFVTYVYQSIKDRHRFGTEENDK